MIIPDTNLLIFAYDSASPHHPVARVWWESVLSGDEPIGVPWVVLLAFTRIMSHPVVVREPLTTDEVRVRVDQWLALDHVRLINPGPQTHHRFFDCLKEAGLGGNLTTDALIATLALELGATVYSNDLDFDRFSGLRRVDPLKKSTKR